PGHADPAAAQPPLAGHRRHLRPAARRQSGRLLRLVRHRQPAAGDPARALRPRSGGGTDPRRRVAGGLREAPAGGGLNMPPKRAPGMLLGGFRLLEPLHEGGMATLWRVEHPDHRLPLLMKLPRIGYGEKVSQPVGFEVERMLLPTLSGP